MKSMTLLAVCLAAAAASPAAPAQATMNRDTGIPTETQDRLRAGEAEIPWDLLGLFGLLGLLGLRRGHSEDSYHPSSLD